MIDGGKLFFQLVRVSFGFIFAVIAAGFFLAWGFFQAAHPESDPAAFAGMVGSGIVSASVLGGLAFIPALCAIGLAEAFRWRGVVFHVAVGGVIAMVIWTLGAQLSVDGVSAAAGDGLRPGTSVAASAGFLGGFVYWLMAGRLSGCWRVNLAASQKSPS